jgi:mono/diheme cytochrome c family protein
MLMRLYRLPVQPRLIAAAFCALASAACAVPPTPSVERGRYLVESILACGNCHTPKDAAGNPIAARSLSGGGLSFSIPPFAGTASNITPDRETGIGSWSDEEMKRAIVEGVRPNHGRLAGTHLGVVMAVPFFKALTAQDLSAVVAYLRSVPPVRNETAAPTYRMAQTHRPFPDAEAGFVEEKMSDPVYRGRYLVTIGHCMECHSPLDKGSVNLERLGAGGRIFNPQLVQGFAADWKGSTSPNITSHPTAGLGRWTDAEIKRAITQGVGRDGRRLQPPMPVAFYARMTPSDLDAIVAYLRTVPPQP